MTENIFGKDSFQLVWEFSLAYVLLNITETEEFMAHHHNQVVFGVTFGELHVFHFNGVS